jgi:hypothetical protein
MNSWFLSHTTMKTMKTSILATAVLLMVAAGAAPTRVAAQDRTDSHPGYVDFDNIGGWFNEEPKLWVNVRGALLRMVVSATRAEDPELSQMLSRLNAVQVRGYSLKSTQPGVDRRVADFARHLEGRGWETVVRVRENGQRVDMFLQMRGERIVGLMVMVIEPGDEAIFVNIAGEVDPDQIGRIGQKFNVRQLEGINVQSGRRR